VLEQAHEQDARQERPDDLEDDQPGEQPTHIAVCEVVGAGGDRTAGDGGQAPEREDDDRDD
jgi:hypothetical protein